MTDRDQLREKVANKIAAWVTLTYAVETYSEDTRAAADVVLDALQLEQVGGMCACGFVPTGEMVPSGNPLGQFGHVIPGEAPDFCGPVVPVYIVREAEG